METNERLEYLIDSVLGYCVADELYRRDGEADEKMLSVDHHKITCGENLESVGRDLGLAEVLQVGRSLAGAVPGSVVGNALEAIVGAIHEDGGLGSAKDFVARTFFEPTRLERALSRKDVITMVKEICDRNGETYSPIAIERVVDGRRIF